MVNARPAPAGVPPMLTGMALPRYALALLSPIMAAHDARPAPHLLLSGHQEDCFAVAFTPDAKRIVSVSRDRTARVWDAETGKELTVFNAAADPMYGMA